RDAMLELIHRIGHEFEITVLLSSHLLEEVERICDAAVILAGGVVAAAGTLDELRGDALGVSVELDGDRAVVDETLTIVHRTGAEIRAEGRGYLITGGADIHHVVRDAIATTGVGVRRLGRRTVSLEEVFLGVGAGADPAQDPRRSALPPPPPPPPPAAVPGGPR
ncbi:MAG TPA: hypothetical protein P5254_15925, partial [Aquihabitans sp.]|nr:hypothetical protein [Aquihabitans sp.]